MANGWEISKCWADQFMVHVEYLIMRSLVSVSIGSAKEDQLENTDLKVYCVRVTDLSPMLRVAVRVRRVQYFEKYPYDVTFRCDRPQSGNTTELEKVLAGWGDLFFYGFGDEATHRVREWVLLSLAEFRLLRPELDGPIPNGDGSSNFMALKLNQIHPTDRMRLIRTASSNYQSIECFPGPPEVFRPLIQTKMPWGP